MSDRLSPTMKRHLLELLDAPHWGPSTPGEWATARALARRGLLDRNYLARERPFSLNDQGRTVARGIKESAGE